MIKVGPSKQAEVRKTIVTHKIATSCLLGIVEAEVRPKIWIRLRNCLPIGWDFAHNIRNCSVASIILS